MDSTRVAMVDQGTPWTMADQGTQEAMVDQGTLWTMTDQGTREAMAGPPSIRLRPEPSYHQGKKFLGESWGSIQLVCRRSGLLGALWKCGL